MKRLKISVILVFTLLFYGCDKPGECDGYPHGEFINLGDVDFSANYGAFANTCVFRELDENYPPIDSCTVLKFPNIENCLLKSNFTIIHYYTLNDTVFLDPLDSSNRLYYTEADIYYGFYQLNPDVKNWILINSLQNDKTILTGEFELSFVLPDLESQIPSDDINRPDTLFYTHGSFNADFVSY